LRLQAPPLDELEVAAVVRQEREIVLERRCSDQEIGVGDRLLLPAKPASFSSKEPARPNLATIPGCPLT
jgi:hypothetical protein